jgi:hypothetical protein
MHFLDNMDNVDYSYSSLYFYAICELYIYAMQFDLLTPSFNYRYAMHKRSGRNNEV